MMLFAGYGPISIPSDLATLQILCLIQEFNTMENMELAYLKLLLFQLLFKKMKYELGVKQLP